eukprot:1147890-Pelagomonas_calceolata.AAC.3
MGARHAFLQLLPWTHPQIVGNKEHVDAAAHAQVVQLRRDLGCVVVLAPCNRGGGGCHVMEQAMEQGVVQGACPLRPVVAEQGMGMLKKGMVAEQGVGQGACPLRPVGAEQGMGISKKDVVAE